MLDITNRNLARLLGGLTMVRAAICFLLAGLSVPLAAVVVKADSRPNILLAVADDWSFPHAGVYGDKALKTPNFDRVAAEGMLFTHAFCAAPSCTPSRAALL